MSLLSDFLLDLIGSGLEPSSERGIVATFSAASLALVLTTLWLALSFPTPGKQPPWGLAVIAGSLICGAGGLLVSLLHLLRNASDRVFGAVCLIVNVAAVGIPLLWTIFR